MYCHLIGGGPQCLVAGIGTVLRLIDTFLQMLDPNAHGKRFWLHSRSTLQQHFKSVPCAVANSEKQCSARNILHTGRGYGSDAADNPIDQKDIFHPAAEADLPAQRKNMITEIRHHFTQYVRTHMRCCIP